MLLSVEKFLQAQNATSCATRTHTHEDQELSVDLKTICHRDERTEILGFLSSEKFWNDLSQKKFLS